MCNLPQKNWEMGKVGLVCTKPPLFLEKAREGSVPLGGRKVRISIFLCKGDRTELSRSQSWKASRRQRLMCPFLNFCISSCRSDCPSRQYVSLQCSRKQTLFLMDCGRCGVGVRGQRVGVLVRKRANPGGRSQEEGLERHACFRARVPVSHPDRHSQGSISPSLDSAQPSNLSIQVSWILGRGQRIGRACQSHLKAPA